ncbi:hypothetical protein IQ276_038410 [Desmonostoc muscorum LEGE 12446]|uniref:Uncharacterized protein n=1 Tax=Desmonostoc muscorum LEGE 12446 TaxID=1828758 RepID=A0A8J6ZVR3_DESMC|nr:hypothetical protein [Desmonostoc muscorum]MCF2152164.1 hypothetical protein [Desmonostoc muscorum LEGE 12446]
MSKVQKAVENEATLRKRKERAPVGSSYYTTVGRLVPITTVMMEVAGVKMEQL